MIVDGAASAEVVVVFGHFQHTFPRHISAAQHVLQKRDYLFGALRAAEGDQHQCVVFQFIPHMPGLLHRPLGQAGTSALFDPPLTCAAKVESSWVRCFSPHEGHSSASASAERRTSFSNLVPQSSQRYS